VLIGAVYQLQEHHVPGNYSPFNRGPLWEQSYNTSTPLYTLTATLNALRTHAINSSSDFLSTPLQSLNLTQSSYITRRGSIDSGHQLVAAYFNTGAVPENTRTTFSLAGAFKGNTEVVEVIKCTTSKTNNDGHLDFQLDGEPKAWYTANNLEGSGLCGRSLGTKAPPTNAGNPNEAPKDEKKKNGGERVHASQLAVMAGVLSVAGFAAVILV
jgi:alpha-amylase